MASSSELADLYLTLRAVNAPMLEGFTQVATAGEEMVSALNAGLAELDASIARTAESLAALRADMASAGTANLGTVAATGEAAASETAAASAAPAAVMAPTAEAEAERAAMAQMAADEAALQAQIEAGYAAIDEKFAEVAAAADRTAATWDADFAAMVASTRDVTFAMAEAQAKVDASWADMTAAEAAYTAKSGALANFTGTMLKVGAAGGIAAAATVKMAADFQTSTTRLITSGGEFAQNLQTDQQGILKLAGDVGFTAGQLSQAMYVVTSSGQHGAQALDTLKAAAQGAKTENADLRTVADAVSTVMIDYRGKVGSASDVTSKLVAATSQGKTNFQDLAGSLSNILPKASAAHIGLDEILGDLASMTQHGMSAQQASENLANAVAHLQSPTMAMSKEMAALGINSTQLASNLGTKGLTGTIQQISDAITRRMGNGATQVILNMQDALKGLPAPVQELSQKVLDGSASWADWNAATKGLTVTQRSQAQSFATLVNGMHTIGTEQMSGAQVMQNYAGAMNKAMGTSDGLNVALMLMANNGQNTATAIQTVTRATADAQGNVQGWSEIQGTFNQKLSEAKGGLDAAAISIGEKLLPAATAIVGIFANIANAFASNKVAATVLAVTIGVLLAGGVVGLTIKLGQFGLAMATNLIKPITGSIGLVRNFIGGLNGAGTAAGTFGGALGKGAAAIGGWMKSLGSAIVSGAQWAAGMIAQGTSVAASAVTSAAKASGAWLASTAKMVGTGVAQAARWAAGMAARFAATVASAVASAAATSAAWLAATARMVGQGIAQAAVWVVGMLVKFATVSAASIAAAAATAAAWIAANAAMIGATGGIILLLTAVVLAVLWLKDHWHQAWHAIADAASSVWHWIDDNIIHPIERAFSWVNDNAIQPLRRAWDDFWNGIKNTASSVWHWIDNNIIHPIEGAINTVKSALSGVGNAVSGVAHFLGFDEGGWVPGSPGQPQLAVVHGGEYVLSRDMLAGRVAPDIPLSNTRGFSPMVAGAGGGSGGSGSGVTVVNMPITVHGSLLTQPDFVKQVQQAVLRLQSRNGSFNTNVAFS